MSDPPTPLPAATRRRVLRAALLALASIGRRDVRARAAGAVPVTLAIPTIGVDAPVEVRTTVAGTMQDPTGPWVAAWYDDSARPGAGGNAVFAGHVDDPAGGGPALFACLGELNRGDAVSIRDDGGRGWRYRVSWARTYRRRAGRTGRG